MLLCLYFYMTPSLESSSVTANDFDNSIIVNLFLITISIRRRIRISRRENIDSVVKDITSQIKDKYDVKISFVEPEYPFFVEGDKTRIYQVISNLISNSVKFTQRGDITITAEIIKNNNDSNDDNGRLVIVRIKDSGTGIDPEIKPRLFSKFSTTSDSGTGLGLYISKNIIEAHRWQYMG